MDEVPLTIKEQITTLCIWLWMTFLSWCVLDVLEQLLVFFFHLHPSAYQVAEMVIFRLIATCMVSLACHMYLYERHGVESWFNHTPAPAHDEIAEQTAPLVKSARLVAIVVEMQDVVASRPDGSDECVICRLNERCIFLPCGHFYTCYECWQQTTNHRCCICNEKYVGGFRCYNA